MDEGEAFDTQWTPETKRAYEKRAEDHETLDANPWGVVNGD
ncbi:hypothetical protein [Knoellia sp. p5-6-4]|nr:hypothetical protein [Knoellia sp. p5-6-4]MDF2144754.1 hypothetical protein [Knoellia sp. p5-6-4]